MLVVVTAVMAGWESKGKGAAGDRMGWGRDASNAEVGWKAEFEKPEAKVPTKTPKNDRSTKGRMTRNKRQKKAARMGCQQGQTQSTLINHTISDLSDSRNPKSRDLLEHNPNPLLWNLAPQTRPARRFQFLRSAHPSSHTQRSTMANDDASSATISRRKAQDRRETEPSYLVVLSPTYELISVVLMAREMFKT